MLLKVLLKKVVGFIEANPVDTGSLIVKIEASNHEMTVEDFILKLDVRHLGTVRALVPGAFPKNLRTSALDINQNIHGAWRIEPKQGN